MAGYCIFRRAGDPAEKAVFVREGFSVQAAVFTVLWALWHRMWVVGAVVFTLSAGLAMASGLGGTSQALATGIQAAIGLLLGLEGHRLREWSLRRSGFDEIGFVRADNLAEAELKYFCERLVPVSPVPPGAYRPAGPSQSDPLGLFGNV